LKPDAVEVPVEADLREHGLPILIGILDLVQEGKVIDFKTSGQTPNAERVAHTNEVQISSYAVLYRHNTGQRENGLELHHLVKTKNPKLVMTTLPPMEDRQQSRLSTLIQSYMDGVDRRDFVPSPGMHCASCQWFNECRAWS
jgi:putative RecB family exonuclease